MEFFSTFNDLLTKKPYILQKYSLRAIVLMKEIISKARSEINEQCYKDLAEKTKHL